MSVPGQCPCQCTCEIAQGAISHAHGQHTDGDSRAFLTYISGAHVEQLNNCYYIGAYQHAVVSPLLCGSMRRAHDVFAVFHAPTMVFNTPSKGSGHGLPIRVQVLNIRMPCSVSRISNVLRSTARKF